MALITIVDRNDEVIGLRERKQKEDNDIYRISGLWLENSKGEILIAQRSFNKKDGPGLWGPAVGGTVENNESYRECIVRETEEELGLTGLKFKIGPKFFLNHPTRRRFCQMFTAKLASETADFKLQEEEVESVRWVTKSWLAQDVSNNPHNYTPAVAMMVNLPLPRR